MAIGQPCFMKDVAKESNRALITPWGRLEEQGTNITKGWSRSRARANHWRERELVPDDEHPRQLPVRGVAVTRARRRVNHTKTTQKEIMYANMHI